MTYLRQAAIAVFASMLSLSAHASELPPLLEVALQKGEAADQIRWAFTSSFENNNASLTFRFEPRGEEGFFTLIAPESLNQDGEAVYARLTDDDDPDSDLTHEQARAVIGEQSDALFALSNDLNTLFSDHSTRLFMGQIAVGIILVGQSRVNGLAILV